MRKRLEDISSTVDPADTEDILAALKSHPVDIYTLLHNKEYLASQGIQFGYEQVADLTERKYTPEDVFEAHDLLCMRFEEPPENEILDKLTYAVLTYAHEEGRHFQTVIENIHPAEPSDEVDHPTGYHRPDFTIDF